MITWRSARLLKAKRPLGSPRRSRGSEASVLTRAFLADFFPGRGGVALEWIGLGLLLVAHLLVEPAGDHLVGHRLRDPQLRERLDLVGHHLVAGGPDPAQHLFDRRRPLDPGPRIPPN